MDISTAYVALGTNQVFAVRRAGRQDFVTLATPEDAEELCQLYGLPVSSELFVYNDGKGGEAPYEPGYEDQMATDWEPFYA